MTAQHAAGIAIGFNRFGKGSRRGLRHGEQSLLAEDPRRRDPRPAREGKSRDAHACAHARRSFCTKKPTIPTTPYNQLNLKGDDGSG
jgi:hypothetical protein